MSKNNLRGITLGIRPLWGIHLNNNLLVYLYCGYVPPSTLTATLAFSTTYLDTLGTLNLTIIHFILHFT